MKSFAEYLHEAAGIIYPFGFKESFDKQLPLVTNLVKKIGFTKPLGVKTLANGLKCASFKDTTGADGMTGGHMDIYYYEKVKPSDIPPIWLITEVGCPDASEGLDKNDFKVIYSMTRNLPFCTSESAIKPEGVSNKSNIIELWKYLRGQKTNLTRHMIPEEYSKMEKNLNRLVGRLDPLPAQRRKGDDDWDEKDTGFIDTLGLSRRRWW